jgi:RTC4-like domain
MIVDESSCELLALQPPPNLTAPDATSLKEEYSKHALRHGYDIKPLRNNKSQNFYLCCHLGRSSRSKGLKPTHLTDCPFAISCKREDKRCIGKTNIPWHNHPPSASFLASLPAAFQAIRSLWQVPSRKTRTWFSSRPIKPLNHRGIPGTFVVRLDYSSTAACIVRRTDIPQHSISASPAAQNPSGCAISDQVELSTVSQQPMSIPSNIRNNIEDEPCSTPENSTDTISIPPYEPWMGIPENVPTAAERASHVLVNELDNTDDLLDIDEYHAQQLHQGQMNICPICGEQMDEVYGDRWRRVAGGDNFHQVSYRQSAKLCRAHTRSSCIKTWVKSGLPVDDAGRPFIDWRRIENCRLEICSDIEKQLFDPASKLYFLSRFNDLLFEARNQSIPGARLRKWVEVSTASYTSLFGFYGVLAIEHICPVAYNSTWFRANDLRQIPQLAETGYITVIDMRQLVVQNVIVPEFLLRLIQIDLHLDEDKALHLLTQTSHLGRLVEGDEFDI